MAARKPGKIVTNMADVLDVERADPNHPEDLGKVLDERVAFSQRAEPDPSAEEVDDWSDWANDDDE